MKLTDENFASSVAKEHPVVVYLRSDRSGPCRLFDPVFEKFAEGREDAHVADVQDVMYTLSRFGTLRLPSVMLFQGERLVATRSGRLTEQQLEELMQQQ